MYYLAVMDCDDEINSVLGDNLNSRLQVQWRLTADHSEYSYEMQGKFHADMAFVVVFCILPFLMSVDFVRFVKRTELLNTPHVYCLIGIFC